MFNFRNGARNSLTATQRTEKNSIDILSNETLAGVTLDESPDFKPEAGLIKGETIVIKSKLMGEPDVRSD